MAAGQLAQRFDSQALHRLGAAGRFNQQAERGLWQDAAALAAEVTMDAVMGNSSGGGLLAIDQVVARTVPWMWTSSCSIASTSRRFISTNWPSRLAATPCQG